MAYLAIVEGEARFGGQSSLRTWLFSVIRNIAGSRWRRARPRRQHEVLDLVFYRDLSISDAAEVLGIWLGTARLHYERGKAALRARLADMGPDA